MSRRPGVGDDQITFGEERRRRTRTMTRSQKGAEIESLEDYSEQKDLERIAEQRSGELTRRSS